MFRKSSLTGGASWLHAAFLLTLGIALSPAHARSQVAGNPFIVSPLIGDTLRPEQRHIYRLFPAVKNFRWAVFYLNTDSSLTARIHSMPNGIPQDTSLPYLTATIVRSRLEYIESRRPDLDCGADVTIQYKDGRKMEGELLTAGGSTLGIATSRNAMQNDSIVTRSNIAMLDVKEISAVTVLLGSKTLEGGFFGVLGGGVAGALIVGNSSDIKASDIVVPAALGGLIGYTIGDALQKKQTIDSIAQNYYKLEDFARFPGYEPGALHDLK